MSSTTFDLGAEATQRLMWRTVQGELDRECAVGTELVRAALGAEYAIDEVALFFRNDAALWSFINTAVRNDWQLFNQADDKVDTRPLQSTYEVRYWFLRRADTPYRIEAMRVVSGFSPYHALLYERVSDRLGYRLAHASFKVATEEAYGSAIHHLTRQLQLDVLQHCESTYGRFSYLQGDTGMISPIKPRLNVRDGGADSGN